MIWVPCSGEHRRTGAHLFLMSCGFRPDPAGGALWQDHKNEITDATGRADVRQIVFAGFSRENVQGLANNLKWGPDNRIYVAGGTNGGGTTGGTTTGGTTTGGTTTGGGGTTGGKKAPASGGLQTTGMALRVMVGRIFFQRFLRRAMCPSS